MNVDAIAKLGAGAPFFLDTNILIYSFDGRSPEKQLLARVLLRHALQTQRGVISSQVVQEFLNAAFKKLNPPMTVEESQGYLQAVLLPLCRHFPSHAFYGFALRLKAQTGYSLYDALVLAAAIENDCKVFLTEDLQHGRVIAGLQIVNPFVME